VYRWLEGLGDVNGQTLSITRTPEAETLLTKALGSIRRKSLNALSAFLVELILFQSPLKVPQMSDGATGSTLFFVTNIGVHAVQKLYTAPFTQEETPFAIVEGDRRQALDLLEYSRASFSDPLIATQCARFAA
jgi:hypothetical protein